jgi:hypothetical protein
MTKIKTKPRKYGCKICLDSGRVPVWKEESKGVFSVKRMARCQKCNKKRIR